MIIASNADIVALSEVRNYHGKDFHERLKVALQERGADYHGYFVEGGDVGMISRWPIDSAEQVTTATRSFITAYHIRAPRKLCVCSAHLDWKQYALNPIRGYDANTFWKLRAPVTNVQKLHEVDAASGRGPALIDFVNYVQKLDDIPVILAGDLNECSHLDWTEDTKSLYGHNGVVIQWKHSHFLEQAGFYDSWRAVYPDPVTHMGATWPSEAFQKKCTSWATEADERDRIDFIYYLNDCGLRAVSSELVGSQIYFLRGELAVAESMGPFLESTLDMRWPSDHKGLLTEFELSLVG